MIDDEALNEVAANVLVIMRATKLSDVDVHTVLHRAIKEMTNGKAACALCHTFVPIGPGAEWPPEHLAPCGLPCVPPGTRVPAPEDRTLLAQVMAHRSVDDCPICHGELVYRRRPVLIIP